MKTFQLNFSSIWEKFFDDGVASGDGIANDFLMSLIDIGNK